MWSFLTELSRDPSATYTVIVMDEDGMEHPRQHRIQPRKLMLAWMGSLVGFALLVLLLVVLTPMREFIPGYGTAEMRQQARLNSLRLVALQDSLQAQQDYMMLLRRLMMGQPDTTAITPDRRLAPAFSVTGELAEVAAAPRSENWQDHEQPALPIANMPAAGESVLGSGGVGSRYLSALQFPLLPPVNGYLTRGFNARIGHFAIDLAVDEGTVVRAIGDGYVIFADWTHDGGFTVAIQHADGYVSVYKHNQRLLKRVGDRVRDREAVAVSGNTGEITMGPHLHFELWRNGLAQDPRYLFIGW